MKWLKWQANWLSWQVPTAVPYRHSSTDNIICSTYVCVAVAAAVIDLGRLFDRLRAILVTFELVVTFRYKSDTVPVTASASSVLVLLLVGTILFLRIY